MSDGTELLPSEGLSGARRNYLLAISVLLAVAAFPPRDGMKMPFIGSDATVPVSLALLSLIGAALYFFYEFYLEVRLTRSRNSELLGDSDAADRAKTFDRGMNRTAARIAEMRQSLDERLTLIGASISDLDARLQSSDPGAKAQDFTRLMGQLDHTVQQGVTTVLARATDAPLQQKFRESVIEELARVRDSADEAISGWRSEVRSGRKAFIRLVRNQEKALARAAELRTELERLNRNISEVRASIHNYQERAFYWKEEFLPKALLSSGVMLATLRILQRGGDGFEGDRLAWVAASIGPAIFLVRAAIYRVPRWIKTRRAKRENNGEEVVISVRNT